MAIKVHMASEAGFCFGVRRAIELAEKAASEGRAVASVGDLVHNSRVIDALAEKNIESFDPEQNQAPAPGTTLLVRAHGLPQSEKKRLAELADSLIDATCPMVLAIKRRIDAAIDAGKLVLLFGKPNHPEAIGLKDGRADVCVVSSAAALSEPDMAARIQERDVCLLAQSTMPLEDFERLSDTLLALDASAQIENTICGPTRRRQQAVLELAARLPLVIVVGDPKSANTAHLVELARRHTRAERVMGPEDLNPEWFRDVLDVGVTAGASTPDDAIEAVVLAIKNLAIKKIN